MQHINRKRIYDIGGTLIGKPSAGGTIIKIPFPRKIRFVVGMTQSQMTSRVAANAEAAFSLKKDGVEFATATFAAAATVATFVCATNTEFAVGEELTITAPGSQDANLEDLGWMLVSERTS